MTELQETVLTALQICCEEEGWELSKINWKSEQKLEVFVKAGGWGGKIGCDLASIASKIDEYDAVIIALSFKDTVVKCKSKFDSASESDYKWES